MAKTATAAKDAKPKSGQGTKLVKYADLEALGRATNDLGTLHTSFWPNVAGLIKLVATRNAQAAKKQDTAQMDEVIELRVRAAKVSIQGLRDQLGKIEALL